MVKLFINDKDMQFFFK